MAPGANAGPRGGGAGQTREPRGAPGAPGRGRPGRGSARAEAPRAPASASVPRGNASGRRAPRLAGLGLGLGVLLLLGLGFPPATSAQGITLTGSAGTSAEAESDLCLLRFELAAPESPLEVGGSVTRPIRAPVASATPAQIGLQGALFVEFFLAPEDPAGPTLDDALDAANSSSADPCPATFAELARRAEAFRLVGAPGFENSGRGAVHLYPRRIDMSVSAGTVSLAKLQLFDTVVDLRSSDVWGADGDAVPSNFSVVAASAAPAYAGNGSEAELDFRGRIFGEVTRSDGVIESPLTGPDPEGFGLVGLGANATVAGAMAGGAGRAVSLRIPDGFLLFSLDDGQISDMVSANITFNASIVGDAVLGCPRTCLAHGTCVLEGGRPTCACECGYAGERCEYALGYCSAFNGSAADGQDAAAKSVFPPAAVSELLDLGFAVDNGTLVVPSRFQAADGAAAPAACGPGAGACGPGETFDASSCTCQCPAGWAGTTCEVCLTDDVCVADDQGSFCDRTLAVTNTTVAKRYYCGLSAANLRDVLQGDINADCDILGEKCTLSFGAYTASEGHYVCEGTACDFQVGLEGLQCTNLECRCADVGCPTYLSSDIDEAVKKVTGPIKVDCKQKADAGDVYSCKLDMKGLPIDITADCHPGTCSYGNGTNGLAAPSAQHGMDTNHFFLIIVASIIGFLLAVIGAFFGFSELRRRHYLAVLSKHGTQLQNNEAVTKFLTPGSAFTFEHIMCVISDQDAKTRWSRLLSRQNSHPTGAAEHHDAPAPEPASKFERKESKSRASPLQLQALGVDPGHGPAGAAAAVPEPQGPDPEAAAGPGVDVHEEASVHVGFAGVPSGGGESGVISAATSHRTADSVTYSLDLQALQSTNTFTRSKSTKDVARLRSRGRRVILDNIHGTLTKGNVMAVMGPSGSGKSTLLNILAGVAGKFDNVKITGSVEVDGQPVGADFQRIAAHVPQEDQQIATLTVRECILYSALLRLPWHWSKQAKLERVTKVIYELGLAHVKNSKVGGSASIRGVSGGERRRVSVGMELVTNPKILFLDEPTSGLDSFTAASIMKTLTKLARNGRMVFVTIHQPSETIFKKLDKVLLLAKGRLIFLGQPKEVAPTFAACGYLCPETDNIADYILEVVSEPKACDRLVARRLNGPGPAGADGSALSAFGRAASAKPAARDLEGGLDGHLSRESFDEPELEMSPTGQNLMNLTPSTRFNLVEADTHQPLDKELLILFWRTLLNIGRHPALLALHCGVSMALGLATGLLFRGVPDTLAGMQNRAGSLFFTLTFFAFGSMTSIDIFMAERQVFSREQRGGYYRVGTYFISKILLDGALLRVLPAVLYGLISYWLIGMGDRPAQIAIFFLTLCLFNLAAGALSMVIAICSPSAGVANLITIVVLLISLLFGGFLANIDTVPVWLGWIRFLSIFYYAFEILFVNELQGLSVNVDDVANVDLSVKSNVLLDVFHFDPANLPRDMAALFALYVGWMVVAYVLLWVLHSSSAARIKRAH